MKQQSFVFALACAMIAGCAATQSNTEPVAEQVDRVYPTGSNIPKKTKSGENVQVYDREALERARTQMPQAPRSGLGNSQ
jgi:hypothetical protein